MSDKTQHNGYYSTEAFYKELIKVFTKIINEKLPACLDFCIHTSNIEPIKQVIAILSVNTF